MGTVKEIMMQGLSESRIGYNYGQIITNVMEAMEKRGCAKSRITLIRYFGTPVAEMLELPAAFFEAVSEVTGVALLNSYQEKTI